jgi:hypothetical protein
MIPWKDFFSKTLQNSRVIFILLIALIGLTALLTWQFIKHETRKIKNDKAQFLKTTTDLKVERLSFWYNDEMADARLIAGNLPGFKVFNNYLADSSAQNKFKLRHYLKILRAEHGYKDIFMTTPDGRVLITAIDDETEFSEVLKKVISRSLATNNTTFSDIYVCPAHKTAHIDFVSPVFSRDSLTKIFIVFRIDPLTDVFPLFTYWPDAKFFHEIKLVRKIGDSISVFIQDQLSGNEPKVTTFFDDKTKSPSRMAANGYKGIYEGEDTRGIKVLSYSRPVDGT